MSVRGAGTHACSAEIRLGAFLGLGIQPAGAFFRNLR
jgi:hypothetical protein